MTNQEFISAVATIVKKYARGYGILVHSPIIAQAIIESNWGKSKLSEKYNNYFGLKCGSKWTGKSVNLKTKEEYTEGTLTTIRDNFRVYDSMEDGVKGYFEFIQLARYQNLKGILSAQMYLETIKEDGYATSSTYVNTNMKIVEQYNLQKYDEKTESGIQIECIAVEQARAWIGKKEVDGTHKEIIDIYNDKKPLARGYKVKYTDAWCATFVSAVSIKCGITDIIPTECGCNQMIKKLKEMDVWNESDARVPNPGDIIFYDWDDKGNGDNVGLSDHVGIVEHVRNNTITIIEGNISNTVGRRTIAVNGKCIRGYGVPRYSTNKEEGIKTIDEIAKEVISGLWGNGENRRKQIETAGYSYKEVQKKVNKLLKN